MFSAGLPVSIEEVQRKPGHLAYFRSPTFTLDGVSLPAIIELELSAMDLIIIAIFFKSSVSTWSLNL